MYRAVPVEQRISKPPRKRRPQFRRKVRRKKTRSLAHKLLNSVTEKKTFLRIESATTISSTAWTLHDLSLITQGDTDATRDGDACIMRSLQIRFRLVVPLPTTTGMTANSLRIIVFQWLPQTNPDATNNHAVRTAGPLISILQPWSHDNRFSYKMLYDRIFDFNPDSYWDTTDARQEASSMVKTVVANIKLANKKLQFDGGTTNHKYNSVWIGWLGFASTSVPTIQYISRLNYSDI